MPAIIITGSRKGLGRALTEHFLAKGWHVAGCSRKETDLTHPAYRHFLLDVADEPAVAAMVRSVADEFGAIDALVNNAGVASMNPIALTPGSTVRGVMDTNVLGSFLFLRECAKRMMRAKSGRIVNLSTVAVPFALEGECAYAASKAAVESMTRVAARELGAHGVTVNAVGPTPVDTDLIRLVPKDKIEALVARQAVPRMGTPADVINAVEFFLRPESSFITGQVIYLGGVF
jgi:3-oxoacyl-[acyl-carrier protein] reductase